MNGLKKAWKWLVIHQKEATVITALATILSALGSLLSGVAPYLPHSDPSPVIKVEIPTEKYEAILERKKNEFIKALAEANKSDQAKITLLEKQLADTQAKLVHVDAALKDYNDKLTQAYQAIDALKAEIPPHQVVQAHLSLAQGDTKFAETIFREVLTNADDKGKMAKAAYQLGQLSAVRLDYTNAHQYYQQAATLQPDNALYASAAKWIFETVTPKLKNPVVNTPVENSQHDCNQAAIDTTPVDASADTPLRP